MITKLHKKKLLALPTPGAAGRCMEILIDLDNVLDILSNLDEFSRIPFSVDIEMLKTDGISEEVRASIAKIDQLETEVGGIEPKVRTYQSIPDPILKLIQSPLNKLPCFNDKTLRKKWKDGLHTDKASRPNTDHIIPKCALSRIAAEIKALGDLELKTLIFSIIGKRFPDFAAEDKEKNDIAKTLYNFGPNLFYFNTEREKDDPGDLIDIFPIMTKESKISTIPKINLYGFQIITDAIMSTYQKDDSGKTFVKKHGIDIHKFHRQLEIGFKFLAVARVLHKKEYIKTRTPNHITLKAGTTANEGFSRGGNQYKTPPAARKPFPHSPERATQKEISLLIKVLYNYFQLDSKPETLPDNIKGAIKAIRYVNLDCDQVIMKIKSSFRDKLATHVKLFQEIEQALNPVGVADRTPGKTYGSGKAARQLAIPPMQDITNTEP